MSTDSFQILVHASDDLLDAVGLQPCPAGSELQSTSDAIEARVLRWTEALRTAELGGGPAEDWKSKSHFVLKLIHDYVLLCVERLRTQWFTGDSLCPCRA